MADPARRAPCRGRLRSSLQCLICPASPWRSARQTLWSLPHGAQRSSAVRLTARPDGAVEERGRTGDDAAPDGARSARRGARSRDATTQPRASRRDAPRDITAGRAGESAHTAKKSRSHCLSIAPRGTPTGSSVAQRAPRRARTGARRDRYRRRRAHAPPLRRRAVRLTAQRQNDARRAPTPTAFCMRPTTATLGIRVTASVTLRELYGARWRRTEQRDQSPLGRIFGFGISARI